jgi:hypothetical protein
MCGKINLWGEEIAWGILMGSVFLAADFMDLRRLGSADFLLCFF